MNTVANITKSEPILCELIGKVNAAKSAIKSNMIASIKGHGNKAMRRMGYYVCDSRFPRNSVTES